MHTVRTILASALLLSSASSLLAGDFDNLDYSSLSAMDASMLSLIRSMPAEDRNLFTQGFLVIQTEVERNISSAPEALDESEVIEIVRSILSNKTIDDVIAMGQGNPVSREALPEGVNIGG